jgi:N-acetyl-anhydromuramyl-L-alanine amidase AmpD
MGVVTSRQHLVKRLDNGRHHSGKRSRGRIDLIVAHATAGGSAMSSIDYLNKTAKKKASYHYVIDRDGTIYRMLPVEFIAWHAGDSAWPAPKRYPPGNGGHSVNPHSIGIAWANDDVGEPLTDEQVESGLWLFRFWMDTLGLPPSKVVGHYEVAPGRKGDPKHALSMREFRQMLAETEIR